MKKVLFVAVALLLFVAPGVVLAQQSAAPAAPAKAPAAPAASAPAPVSAPATQAAPASSAQPAVPAAGLTISRMEIAGSIENRQPSGVAASFPATQEKVYCYLELKDVAKDQAITFAWTFGQDTDKVNQQVKKSARWRTWGNKSIAGRKGDWKVEVLDESGTVLKSATFKVE